MKSDHTYTQVHEELKEGVTYQSNMGVTDYDELQTITIPSHDTTPLYHPVLGAETKLKLIFDLETTSLYDNCELTQIAATTTEGEVRFSQYILPEGEIDKNASKVTGITKSCNRLFLNGRPVSSVSLSVGLQMFSHWLMSFKANIILVAHNAKSFDAKHFV